MSVEFELKAGRLIEFAKIALASMFVALLSALFSVLAGQHWVNKKKTMACLPTSVEHNYPLVYQQSAINLPNDDALLKNFILKYVRLMMNEEAVDYFKATSDKRYDRARLSKAKWDAVMMTEGMEKKMALERYAKSNETYYLLESANTGWTFLVDAVVVRGTPGSGSHVALVYGEYQLTRDLVKTSLPHQLYGYKEILLIINQQGPTVDRETGGVLNKYGLYVSFTNTRTLSPEERDQALRLNEGEVLLRD